MGALFALLLWMIMMAGVLQVKYHLLITIQSPGTYRSLLLFDLFYQNNFIISFMVGTSKIDTLFKPILVGHLQPP